MEFALYTEFFSSFSLPTLIIAIIVATACSIADKILKDKISYAIKNQIPFILSVILNFLYDAIFVSFELAFSGEALLSGILSGSVATIITTLVSKITNGECIDANKGATLLLIEGLLRGLLPDSAITEAAFAIEQILLGSDKNSSQTDGEDFIKHKEKQTIEQIVSIIKQNKTDVQINVESDEQLYVIAELIIQSVNAL